MDSVDFGQLYESHADDVLRFAYYLTADRTEAEDVTSETFVRAWVARDAIRVGTVKAYLFSISRNLCRMRTRREAARAERIDDRFAASLASPARQAEERSELERVLRWMQTLPETDRAALLMRAQGGLAYEEVAAALEISVAAARVKVHRARMQLHVLERRSEADEDHA